MREISNTLAVTFDQVVSLHRIISDTALAVAFSPARESQRPEALFHDPLAVCLFGRMRVLAFGSQQLRNSYTCLGMMSINAYPIGNVANSLKTHSAPEAVSARAANP